jgi:hypothetical protein
MVRIGLKVQAERPNSNANLVPSPEVQRPTTGAAAGIGVECGDFRFRLPPGWRVDRKMERAGGGALWISNADDVEVALSYAASPGLVGVPSSEVVLFLANHLGSGEAAEALVRGFETDAALFEAAYALTADAIDVRADPDRVKRDAALFNWKSATGGTHRLDGAGARAYVGSKAPARRGGRWVTVVNLLDDRGRYRGSVLVYDLEFPDPAAPADAVVRELVATARFDEHREPAATTEPVAAPAGTRPATDGSRPAGRQ